MENERTDCLMCNEPATHLVAHTSGRDTGRLQVKVCATCLEELTELRERYHVDGITPPAIEVSRLPNVVPGFWADDWSDVVGPAFVFGLFCWMVL